MPGNILSCLYLNTFWSQTNPGTTIYSYFISKEKETKNVCVCVCVCVYIYTHCVYIYIYIYIYTQKVTSPRSLSYQAECQDLDQLAWGSLRAWYLPCSSVSLVILTVFQQTDHGSYHENSYLQSWKLEGSGTIFTDHSGTELPFNIICTSKIVIVSESRRILSDTAGS